METEQAVYFWGMELVLVLIALGVGVSNLRWWQGLAILVLPTVLWIVFDISAAGQALTSDGLSRRMVAVAIAWRFGETGGLFAVARGARLVYIRWKKVELEKNRRERSTKPRK